MKIAYAVTEFPLLSESFVLNQVTGLLDLGLDVEVQAIHRGDFSYSGSRADQLRRRTRTWRMPWGPAVRLARSGGAFRGVGREEGRALRRALNPFRFGRNGWSLRLLYAARSFVGRSYDVVHCHFGPNGETVGQIKELGLTDARLVTTFHGYDLREAEGKRPDRIYPHLKRHGDLFLAVSRYSRRRLVELGFDESRIVEHSMGIDLERFRFRWEGDERSAPPAGRLRILSVGRLAPEKGHVHGVRAVHELRRRRPALELTYTIVGDGSLRDEIEALAAELGMTDVVRLRGALPPEEVAAAMQHADVFLLPSVAEILPVVLMEAHATGLPVVSTDVGATSEIVEDGVSGHLAPPGDPAALADRLEQVADHPERHRDMGAHGRRIVEERFDIRKLNRRLADLLTSL